MRFPRISTLAFFWASFALAQDPDATWHAEARRALATDTYADFLTERARIWDPNQRLTYIAKQLRAIRKLDSPNQQAAMAQIYGHESKRHGTLRPSAVQWQQRVPVASVLDPARSPEEIAELLVQTVLHYEHGVMHPLMAQMERELLRDFREEHFLCIGRDFTPFFLYLIASGKIPRHRIHNVNVSRDVKDRIFAGETEPMLNVLRQLRLSPKVLVQHGLVFLDSSMAGKIPKAMMRAILETLSDSQALEFLKKVSIRYAMSKSVGTGLDFGATLGAATKQWKEFKRDRVLKALAEPPNFEIKRFELNLPSGVNWEADHVHNLFEHRPKFVSTGTRFENEAGVWTIATEVPNTPQGKLLAALGLIADLASVETQKEVSESASTSPVDSVRALEALVSGDKSLPRPIRREIEGASKHGIPGLREWQNESFDISRVERSRVHVAATPGHPHPLGLFVDDQMILPLVRSISEGRNMVVYETPDGLALKVAKNPKVAKKTFLESWGDSLLDPCGIAVSHLRWLSQGGILSLHELVRGETLEYLYGFSEKPAHVALPTSDRNQILRIRASLQKLADETGIFFDAKAANFVKDQEGRIVFVDRVPRLNKGYRTYYFAGEAGQSEIPLSDSEFLEEFLHHDISQGKSRKRPGGPACDRILSP